MRVALHVDHIIPRSKGGPDELNNFQALCMSISAKLPIPLPALLSRPSAVYWN